MQRRSVPCAMMHCAETGVRVQQDICVLAVAMG